MRRTITTLMFLAVGGLISIAQAADGGNANWQYYAAANGTYRISDDDDTASAGQSHVANAGGTTEPAGQEQNALYVADRNAVGTGIAQTNFFDNGGGCCNGCDNCGCKTCISDCYNCDCSTTMVRLEWLGWFTRGRNTPPLVTTSNAADLAVLGAASTVTLYGNDPIGTNLRNGGRITLSHLMGDGLTTITGRFWGIENGAATFAANSATFPVLGIPFFNANLAQEDAFLVAFPGLTDPGSVRVLSKNSLFGADAWGSRNWFNDGSLSVDVLGGYQFVRLDDSITMDSNFTSVGVGGNLPPVGTTFNIFDSFRTRNQFHGGTLGLLARSYRGPITLEGLFKVGLGNMNQTVIVNGRTTETQPGGPATVTSGGIFALPSNIGTQTHNHFCYVPELNANLLYNINSNWRAMVGYSFLYWNQVVLAGNQIDRNVNLGQTTGGPQVPQPRFSRTDFWVQGISLGADYRW
jgi:hypothetical protein